GCDWVRRHGRPFGGKHGKHRVPAVVRPEKSEGKVTAGQVVVKLKSFTRARNCGIYHYEVILFIYIYKENVI
ncbi:MAG: hypothetical protein U1D35_02730, partial [Paracoccaceae bacterium]|nr:hypothetical protein [Paracoccaceae bacterium]